MFIYKILIRFYPSYHVREKSKQKQDHSRGKPDDFTKRLL